MRRHWIVALLLISLSGGGSLFAQEMEVRGKVVSVEGEPLPGVNIGLKGTAKGTVTDADGDYAISVPSLGALFYRGEAKPVLVFSYTGFRTVEVAVEEEERLDVVLQPEAAELAEIVVTGTAAGQSRQNMSYSVGTIDEKLMTTVPAPNTGSGLQGKVPGLRVYQGGGQPGQGSFFQIRSANSIANGQQPLILVDGVFLSDVYLADLNPEDIDKVEVLKGPAGASLYGSQAANGVIQVFTKRGSDLPVGETRVEYAGEAGFSEAASRYDINTFTNREIIDPSGPQPILGNPTPENISNIPLPNLQDYQDEFLFQRGLFQSNYLSVQGKTEKTNFLASYQRLRDEGIIRTSDGYTRNAFRVNLDHQVSNRFSVQLSSLYSFSDQDLLAPTSNGPGSYLAANLFMTPMFDLDAVNEEDNSSYDWDIDNTGAGITNPLYDRANSDQQIRRSRLLGNASVNYYPKDWLTLNYSATLDRSARNYEHFLQKGYLSTNIPGWFGNLATAGIDNSNGGGVHHSSLTADYFTSRVSAIVERDFGRFNTAVRASFLYEDLTRDFEEGIGEDLAVADVRSLNNARRNISIASESQQIVAYSGFLVGDVDYQDTYIFSGLFRREGSSLFGPENRWSNYYRLSAAYRLTNDVRIKGVQELKLRASIGTAGIRPTFNQRFETYDLTDGTVAKNTLGNEFLRPAESRELEVGVNATLFRAFDLEFNYAEIETEDQILLVPLSAGTGFVGQWKNAGTISATVYEAGLNTNFALLFKIRNPDFVWNLWTTFDRVEQTIAELNVPAYNTGPGFQASSLFLIEEGASFGTMVGEVFATSPEQLEGQEGVDPGDYAVNSAGYVVRQDQLGTPEELPYKLLDSGGNPLVQPIGDINPDFRMGFAHTIGYKNFELYTLFDWKKGGDVYNMTRHWLYRDLRHGDVSSYPDIAAGFFGSNGLYNVLKPNNHFVEDGSFFMLREAAVSYTFRIGRALDRLRLSLIGRNLFTLTDYTGFHPDVTSIPRDESSLVDRVPDSRGSDIRTPNGDPGLFFVDSFNYPLARTVTFRLQATF